MKKQTRTLFIFCLIVLIGSCKKDTELLPEATSTGKGIFSCMYDGKVLNIPGAYATYGYDDLTGDFYVVIKANHSTTANPETIYIGLVNVFAAGPFPSMGGNTGMSVSLPNSDYAYRSYSGSVEITTLDTINKIVSGTFNSDMVLTSIMQPGFLVPRKRPGDKDSLSIRSGRFDLPLTAF